MASLEQRLAEYKSGNPELPVVLKADAAAHYEKVSEVLEICKKLDITEVGLITKKVAE
jgi:biopolymer transport protein ExbD